MQSKQIVYISVGILFLHLIVPVKSDVIAYSSDLNQLIEEFRSLPAAFGPQLPSEGLFVLALRALPSHACSPVHDRSYVDEDLIKEYNGTAPSITKLAVLVRRGDCSFETKVRNVQAAGYDAVIIYDRNTNILELMTATNDNDIKIPAVFVGNSTSREIIRNYRYHMGKALKLDAKFSTEDGGILNRCLKQTYPYKCGATIDGVKGGALSTQ